MALSGRQRSAMNWLASFTHASKAWWRAGDVVWVTWWSTWKHMFWWHICLHMLIMFVYCMYVDYVDIICFFPQKIEHTIWKDTKRSPQTPQLEPLVHTAIDGAFHTFKDFRFDDFPNVPKLPNLENVTDMTTIGIHEFDGFGHFGANPLRIWTWKSKSATTCIRWFPGKNSVQTCCMLYKTSKWNTLFLLVLFCSKMWLYPICWIALTSFYIVSDFLSNPLFDSFEISKGLRLSRIPLHWARAQWPHETSHVQHERHTWVIKRLRGWRVGSDVPRLDPSRCIYDTWDEKRWKVSKCEFFCFSICQAWETTWIHRSLRCSKIWILQESNSHFVRKDQKEFPRQCTLRFQFTRSTEMAIHYHMGHSSSVVAPIHCNSPRASAGFNRFALVGSA